MVVGETRRARGGQLCRKTCHWVSPVELLPASQLLAGPTRAHTPSLGQETGLCRPEIARLWGSSFVLHMGSWLGQHLSSEPGGA